MNAPGPRFDHLARMTDEHGLFEHADGTEARREHGYCVDDNARLLLVASREADRGEPARLSRTALAFTLAAQDERGRSRNRMNVAGDWTDTPTTEDCWGRALWGLGVAAARHPDANVAAQAMTGFERGVGQRSRWPRAMAFAALGATDVLGARPGHERAQALLIDALRTIGSPGNDDWAWPEVRLAYANATLAEAVIAAASALGDMAALKGGLRMLAWLLERETPTGHLSLTPVGGASRMDVGPRFDQQPIECAAMADACWRAFTLTGAARWADGVRAADAWFDGRNDTGAVMWDPVSGGGFDGLQRTGVNLNQGAESTLALVSTRQRAASLAVSSRR